MSNIKDVFIEGWMPFNIYENDTATRRLGLLNCPSIGLKINYGLKPGDVDAGLEANKLERPNGTIFGSWTKLVPNDCGGHTVHYRFVIDGQEAVHEDYLRETVNDLVAAGCEIYLAQYSDIENKGLVIDLLEKVFG